MYVMPNRDVFDKLPRVCGARHPTTNEPILIKRGINGCFKMKDGFDPEFFNKKFSITEAQVEAMLIGSAFGWDVPGADPDNY